jgi:two-component system cell cycle sensor histidine kinase/response regulator CckA
MFRQSMDLFRRARKWRFFTHLVACLLPVAALALQLTIEPVVPQTSYQLFLGAVVLSALLGGIVDGALTLAISAAGRFLFFPEPRFRFAWENPAILVRLVLFVVIGASVAWLVGRLRLAQGQLAAALTSTVDGIVLTNARNHIIFLNRVAESLTGWTRKGASGRPLEEVVQLTPGESDSGTFLVSKNGALVPVERSIAPIHGDGGRVRGSIAVFRDVSERRQFEDQLRQAQKMEALGRLASGVAHDFNNLLTVIGGHAELIAGALDAAHPLRRSAEAIQEAFDQATRLTRQLLVFSKGRTAQPRILDLNKVLGNLQATLRSLAGEGVSLVTNFEPRLGRVKADAGQVEQVVVNLLVNARDAMPKGGDIQIRTRNVRLDAASPLEIAKTRPGAYVALDVIDTGTGMDENTKSRIFEPFFTTKQPGKGTGLGLAIVYGIVRQCGGHIQVNSEPGHGSTFTVLLPRSDDFGPEPEPPEPPPRSSAERSTESTGVILLAEDDDPLRSVLTSALESAGYEVLAATDGARALNIAASELNRIDLVVTDIEMPVVSGTELMECLWTLEPKLRVVYMSGHAELDDAVTRSRANVRFIAKPFSLNALLAEISALLTEGSHKAA